MCIRDSFYVDHFRMGNLYPLLMLPGFDPRPWGTQDLSPIYPNRRFEEKIGEAWLTGDDCKIANGPLTGLSLIHISPGLVGASFRALAADCRDSAVLP